MTTCIGHHTDTPPEAKTGFLCSPCRNRLSSTLVNLPSLAVWLHDNLAAGGSGVTERVSRSKDDPIPLRTDILDFIGPTASRELSETMGSTTREPNSAGLPERVQIGEPSLLDVVGSWCLLVSEERNDEWPNHNDLASLSRWLHSQLDWIVCQPWVDEMLANLIDMSRKAERLAPRDAERRILKPPCPSCNCRSLVFTRGEGVRCETRMGGCGRSWMDAEFDRLLVVLGHEAMGMSA